MTGFDVPCCPTAVVSTVVSSFKPVRIERCGECTDRGRCGGCMGGEGNSEGRQEGAEEGKRDGGRRALQERGMWRHVEESTDIRQNAIWEGGR